MGSRSCQIINPNSQMNSTKVNQFRSHLKFSIRNQFRLKKAKYSLGFCGSNVWIDKNVEFQRHKKKIFIEENVAIKEGTKICVCNKKAEITIGKNTTIGYYNFIFASTSIKIGNNCLIAPFVYIVDSDHQINKNELINQQSNRVAEIIIEDDVWIASNVTILKGVKIGKGAVIAANSVVNSTIPEYEIWGGSPAKKISERK